MATPAMARPEVTVRGGGVFGLSCAFALARRGARVRLVESRAIGAGASGGLVGALAPHVPENWNEKKQFQLESLLMAQGFWGEVAQLSGKDPGYARHGRLQPLLPGDGALTLAQERGRGAAGLWQGRAKWRIASGAAFGAWGGFGPVIHDTLSARIAPRAALAALAAAFQGLGGDLVIGDAADRGAVLWCTGAEGLAALIDHAGQPAGTGIKGQAALLAHDARDLPQWLADGLHIVPHADGTVAVGSTTERDFAAADTTDDALEALIRQARAQCPVLADAPVVARWAGLRPRAVSRAPLLGPWPGRPGHYIANGGFKIGFGMAPKVAEVMADLLLEDRDTIPGDFRTQ